MKEEFCYNLYFNTLRSDRTTEVLILKRLILLYYNYNKAEPLIENSHVH